MTDREHSISAGNREGQLQQRMVLAASVPERVRTALPWVCGPDGELCVTQRFRTNGAGYVAELEATGGGYHATFEVSCAFLIALFDVNDPNHEAACVKAAVTLQSRRHRATASNSTPSSGGA